MIWNFKVIITPILKDAQVRLKGSQAYFKVSDSFIESLFWIYFLKIFSGLTTKSLYPSEEPRVV